MGVEARVARVLDGGARFSKADDVLLRPGGIVGMAATACCRWLPWWWHRVYAVCTLRGYHRFVAAYYYYYYYYLLVIARVSPFRRSVLPRIPGTPLRKLPRRPEEGTLVAHKP